MLFSLVYSFNLRFKTQGKRHGSVYNGIGGFRVLIFVPGASKV
jgi:hypothetical protein